MLQPTSEDVVREFWRLMSTNDFASVAAVFDGQFVLDWPQTGERIRGAANSARLNNEYPAAGPWRFSLNRLVAGPSEVATDVTVSDGVQSARAITFFDVEDGKIQRMTEFWPDSYDPPHDRSHLVERIE